MKKQLGRFLSYFCIVFVICVALAFLADLPTGGFTGVLISGFIALSALTFENKNPPDQT